MSPARPPCHLAAFGDARNGQLGVSAAIVSHLPAMFVADQPQSVQPPVRTRRPFRPPIKAGSELERRYYGQMRKSLSHLPREEQRHPRQPRPAHAWRCRRPRGSTSDRHTEEFTPSTEEFTS